ncbi:MAG: hypothetical protein M0P35_00650 [Bacteroidales bacterium]|jgi:hypothetical protein|nr:hypothetical protein [Bacteroidales bacterium]
MQIEDIELAVIKHLYKQGNDIVAFKMLKQWRLKKIKKAQNKRAEIHAAVIKVYKDYDI